MKTENEIKQYLEKLRKDNPPKFLRQADDGTRGWFQGMVEALRFVLDDEVKK